jgi:polyisoprenyl-phosphate glycosyltransferase
LTINLADNRDARIFGGHPTSLKRLAILAPVLDDWNSFVHLVENIAGQHFPSVEWIEIVAVDDGSADVFDLSAVSLPIGGCVRGVRIVHLALNLGHQRAVAAGLVTLADRKDLDGVIVMDSDGEDRPEELPALVHAFQASPGRVILARRRQRSESMMFRAGYQLYRFFFRVLTGRAISFGNFSILPLDAVRRLVHMPELWNNLPAAIIRSRLPFVTVDTVRGTRYSGHSKMDFANLVIHGLSAMSVYTDLVFVRVLLAASVVSVLAFAAIIVVIGVRLTTTLAIPGWATTIFGDLLIILFQAIFTIIAITLLVLAGRSARPTIPKSDAQTFIRAVSESFPAQHRLKQLAKSP